MLFTLYQFVKITDHAISEFLSEGALHFSHAQAPCYNPAGPAGVCPIVRSLKSLFNRRGTCSKIALLDSSRLASAPFEYPAIQPCFSFCHFLPSSVIDTIIAGGIDDIVVVIRDDNEELKNILSGLPLRIAYNRTAESEMAESVRSGLHASDASAAGVMVCLSDHPLVTAENFNTLLHIHKQKPEKILIPEYNGKKCTLSYFRYRSSVRFFPAYT